MQGLTSAAAAPSGDPERLRAVDEMMASIFAVENPAPGTAQGSFRGRWHAAPGSPPPAPYPTPYPSIAPTPYQPEPASPPPQLFLPHRAPFPPSTDVVLAVTDSTQIPNINPDVTPGVTLQRLGSGSTHGWGAPHALGGGCGSGGSSGSLRLPLACLESTQHPECFNPNLPQGMALPRPCSGSLHAYAPLAAGTLGGSGGSLRLLEGLLSMPSMAWDELLSPRAGAHTASRPGPLCFI